jgi:hypothetical protein
MPEYLIPWHNKSKGIYPKNFIPFERVFVIEVKCSELIPSTHYPTGITARFPRCMKMRHDKQVTEVMTLQELNEFKLCGLRSANAKKENAKSKGVGEKVMSNKMRRTAVGVDNVFTASSEVASGEGIFIIQTYCVKNFVGDVELGDGVNPGEQVKFSREIITSMIQRNGGSVIANPRLGSYIIAGSKFSVELHGIACRALYNILHFSFIVDSLRANALLEPRERHFLAKSDQTTAHHAGLMDEFGDSYFEDTDVADLRGIVDRMTCVQRDWSEIYGECEDEDLMEVIREIRPLYSSTVIVYVDMFLTLGSVEGGGGERQADEIDVDSFLQCEAPLLRIHGATIASHLSSTVTHILIHPLQLPRRELIQERIRMLRLLDLIPATVDCEKRVVNPSWTRDCIARGRIIFDPLSSHDASSLLWGKHSSSKGLHY